MLLTLDSRAEPQQNKYSSALPGETPGIVHVCGGRECLPIRCPVSFIKRPVVEVTQGPIPRRRLICVRSQLPIGAFTTTRIALTGMAERPFAALPTCSISINHSLFHCKVNRIKTRRLHTSTTPRPPNSVYDLSITISRISIQAPTGMPCGFDSSSFHTCAKLPETTPVAQPGRFDSPASWHDWGWGRLRIFDQSKTTKLNRPLTAAPRRR